MGSVVVIVAAAGLAAVSTTGGANTFDAINLVYIALGALASFILIFGAFRGGFRSSVSSAMRQEMASPAFKEAMAVIIRETIESQINIVRRDFIKITDDLDTKYDRVLEKTARLEGRIGYRNGNGGSQP